PKESISYQPFFGRFASTGRSGGENSGSENSESKPSKRQNKKGGAPGAPAPAGPAPKTPERAPAPEVKRAPAVSPTGGAEPHP
ncbi:MAG TPA: hypothetical protein VES65_09585, partial [Solirubrobacteraceae bacterium]|nr:hypothetical protein [Solirubrobacteraceae bacterium]